MGKILENPKFKRISPYLIVFASFSAGVIILVMIIDLLLLPMLIHDRGTVKVPDLTGKTMSDAEKILAKAGLKVQSVTEQYSETAQSGTVISQIPKPDQEIKNDRGIYLTISRGQETVKMPSVIGQQLRTAKLTITNSGLVVGSIDYQNSDIYGKDTIVKQNKTKDMSVPYGTAVNIVVSLGAESQIAVPSLSGKPYDEIDRILKESNLVIGEVTYVKDDGTYVANTVKSQSPESGAIVKAGTKINVVVTK